MGVLKFDDYIGKTDFNKVIYKGKFDNELYPNLLMQFINHVNQFLDDFNLYTDLNSSPDFGSDYNRDGLKIHVDVNNNIVLDSSYYNLDDEDEYAINDFFIVFKNISKGEIEIIAAYNGVGYDNEIISYLESKLANNA